MDRTHTWVLRVRGAGGGGGVGLVLGGGQVDDGAVLGGAAIHCHHVSSPLFTGPKFPFPGDRAC